MEENMTSKNKTFIKYDPKADALYIIGKKGVEEEFIEIAPGVGLEIDERGDVLGIEILHASRLLRTVFTPSNKLEALKA